MADQDKLMKIEALQSFRLTWLADEDERETGIIPRILERLGGTFAEEAALVVESGQRGAKTKAESLGNVAARLNVLAIEVTKRLAQRQAPAPGTALVPVEREPLKSPSWTDSEALDALVAEAEDRDRTIRGLPEPGVVIEISGPADPVVAQNLKRISEALAFFGESTHHSASADPEFGLEYPDVWPRDDVEMTGSSEFFVDEQSGTAGLYIPFPAGDAPDDVLSDWSAHSGLFGEAYEGDHSISTEVQELMRDDSADKPEWQIDFGEAGDIGKSWRRPRGPVPPSMKDVHPWTWSELSSPIDASDVSAHMSPSQLSKLDTCPAQARMTRRSFGIPQVPHWSNVGGTAFHAFVEEYELATAMNGLLRELPGNGEDEWVSGAWQRHLSASITGTIMLGSGVSMHEWNASRGKENYDWWRVEGAEMCKRYVAWRTSEAKDWEVLALPDGSLAIEHEMTMNSLASAPDVVVRNDIVFVKPDDTTVIVDLKTGSRTPDDTIQLGTQARALLNEVTLRNPRRLDACYFDARKGQLTEAFDPLIRHQLDELIARYSDAQQRKTQAAMPRPSSLCVACPVRYLCPAGDRR